MITLREREDFERFLRLMAHKGENAGIPATQGAAILDGVINWTKIRAHEAEFFASGGKKPDWDAELERFLSVKENYRDALIVLSWGPYSAVPAEETEYPEEEWLRISHVIRKTHECTHFICRRLFPELMDGILTGLWRSASWASGKDATPADAWKTTFRTETAPRSTLRPERPRRSCGALRRSSRKSSAASIRSRHDWRRRSDAGNKAENTV